MGKKWEKQIEDFEEDESSEDQIEVDSDVRISDPYSNNKGFLDPNDMVRWVPGKKKKRELARQEAKNKVRTNTFADKLNNRAHLTNDTKKKNKPYMMIADKLKNKAVDLFESIRKTKNKLGK